MKMLTNARRHSLNRQASFERFEDRRLLAADISFAEPIVYEGKGLSAGVIVGDVDRDGDSDLIDGVFPRDGRSSSLLLGRGDGTFDPSEAKELDDIRRAEFVDLNNDGFLDVVAPTFQKSGVAVSLNMGIDDGRWMGFNELEHIPIQGSSIPQGIGVGDFNGDEYPDIVVADNTEVWILINDGVTDRNWLGFASMESLGENGRFPDRVVPGDLDDDGDLDLVVGNYFGGDIAVLLGNGDGSFEHKENFPIGERTGPLELRDLDDDGNLDVVAVVFHTNEVAVLMGQGDGSFKPKVSYLTKVAELGTMTVMDLEGDDDLDVVVVSDANNSEIRLLANNGDGTFGETEADLPIGPDPAVARHTAVADLDSDGDQDLVVTTAVTAGSGFGVNVFLNDVAFNVSGRASIGEQTLNGLNLARDQVASQSTTRRNSSRFAASNATDGSVRTISRTEDGDTTHSWQVELNRNILVDRIVIVLNGASQESLDGDGMQVHVLDDHGVNVWSETYMQAADSQVTIQFPSDEVILGRSLRITKPNPAGSSLRLNEVEVYGREFVLAPQRVVEFDLNAEESRADLLRLDIPLNIAGGTMRARLVDGALAEGMEFKVLDAPMTTGAFDRIVLPDLPEGLGWNLSRLYEAGALSVASAGPDGDFDGNGEVDFADFQILSSTFGSVGVGLLADANRNGRVDFGDFLVMAANFE